MKLGRIFRFEFAYQLRRPATWLFFAVLFLAAWSIIQSNYVPDARDGWLLLNAPLVIASTTVVSGMLWLFLAASIAGDAAARDIESGLHPISYSAPASRFQYLAGRFLAAYALNALVLHGLFAAEANYEIVSADELPLAFDALDDVPEGLAARPYLRSVG